MFSALYQRCFQEWDIQYQTDTRGNAYKAIFPALVRSSLPIRSFLLLFSVCALVTANWTIICHALAFTVTGSVASVKYLKRWNTWSKSVPNTWRRESVWKLALNQFGISFHTPEILHSTAAAKLVETFVRELGVRLQILFTRSWHYKTS